MSKRVTLSLFVLCCCFAACSEESADNPANNLADTATSDTTAGTDSTSNPDNGSSGGDSSAVCGNGQIEADEACDDGPDNSDEISDACRTNCRNATCGDGVVDDEGLSEQCDDGNRIDDDGCNNVCRLPSCGDGVLQTDEQCDDGPQNSDTRPDACRSDCTSARCGDSVTDTNEDCDDANDLNNDACLSCVNARCGDGFIRQNVESCDDQNGSGLDGCSDLCRLEQGFSCESEPSVCTTTCGDGVIGGLETCDDANDVGGDYCSADCSAVIGRCGDNILQTNETCDDGNILNGDACAANCQQIAGGCGDGITQTNEVCDDGNDVSGDYCAANCQSITGFCGDDTQQTNETCDDGNTLSGDYCSANCAQITGVCGDGTTQNNEQCDDGNTIIGDYCSPSCISTGFCGDGLIQTPANEACDDGNTQNSDGCSGNCAFTEPGWSCAGVPTNCVAILCAVNQRVQNSACVACPPGTTNTAGDDATGPDTPCDTVLCAVNQHVVNNACVDCPPGSTNAGGDNATGSNTSCDIVLCAADQYVENHLCTPCPAGSSNVAGDDATGSNTTCDTIFCAANQHVVSNTCVDCPPGTINDPGDNATGSDTSCTDDPCYPILGVLCADFEQAYIKASNTGADDQFGYAVALDGDTLAVGALGEDSSATGVGGNQADNAASGSGAVYVFVRSGTTWTQQAYIKASNTGANDSFGISLALSGDTLVVGASGEGSSATGVNGNQADNSASNSGAAYVFVRSGTTWTQQAYIKASNTGANDSFGYTVALSGDTLAVGAYWEDSFATGVNGNQADNSITDSGAVYVFVRSGTTWTQQAYIKASNTGSNDRFGGALSLSGDTLAVGALGEASNATGINGSQTSNLAAGSGAVYVFVRSGTAWTQQAYIKASNTAADDYFGSSVALSGNALAVGAYGEDSNATGINGNQADNSISNSGAVYVFTRSGTIWGQLAYIKASNPNMNDYFGYALAVSGDSLIVGAPYEASNATGLNGSQTDNTASQSGAVYVFSSITVNQQAYIKASNTSASDYFGFSVALSGDTLAVGALGEDSSATGVGGNQADNAASLSGAVYIRKIKP